MTVNFGRLGRPFARFSVPKDTPARIAAVRASGPILANGHTAGSSSDFRASWLFLKAFVFPGGIILSMPAMSPRVILASEVRRITEKRSIFGPRLEVEHAGVGTGSPLVLRQRADSPIGRALSQVSGPVARDIQQR